MRLFNILLILLFNSTSILSLYFDIKQKISYNSKNINIIDKFPFLIGRWLLRSTNDIYLKNTHTYLEINDNYNIRLKTIYQDKFIGKKINRKGIITKIYDEAEKTYIDIKYDYLNRYSLSVAGIKIPEIIDSTEKTIVKKKFNIELYDKTLILQDKKLPVYYIFDLCVGKSEPPFIETYLNTFVITQFIVFFLNYLLAKFIHDVFNG